MIEHCSEEHAKRILVEELPHWQFESAPSDRSRDGIAMRIVREYVFSSFIEAIGFMSSVAPECDKLDHHPRWINVFNKLTVQLSTWEKRSFKITHRDIELARFFDRAYDQFGTDKTICR